MPSFLFSLLGWTFIPDFLTSRVLAQLHRLSLVPPTQKGTLNYRRQYGLTFAFVVLSYLLYTMVQSARSLEPNYYEILGVPPDVDESGLKVAFRQFAKKYHPDRPDVGRGGEEMFMRVRDAFEALKDPVKRFAYDRFGPDVLHWKHCSTTREFLNHGLLHSSGYHIVTAVMLLFWSAIGKPSPVSYWRYIIFASLLLTELSIILTPSPSHSSTFSLLPSPTQRIQPTIFTLLFPRRVTYQHVLFLHQLFMFLSVALSRVAPQLFPVDEDPRVEAVVLERIRALVGVADRESAIMLHTELRSILPSSLTSKDPSHPSLARPAPLTQTEAQEALGVLVKDMENLIIETNVKKDVGPLRSAWESAIRRRGQSRVSSGTFVRQMNFWEAQGQQQGRPEEGEGEEEEGELTARPKPFPALRWQETVIPTIGELPSPRPSPPPMLGTGASPRKASYTRGRSVSY